MGLFSSGQRLKIGAVACLLFGWGRGKEGRGVFLSYNGVAEGSWGNSTDHFLELVGVDAESVKCARLGEFTMCSV